MVIAGLPFLRVELTRADATVLPKDATAHQVDSEIRSSFPADPASRIVVVVEAPRGEPEAAIHDGTRALRSVEGVDGVGPPVRVSDELVRVDAQLTVDSFSDEAVDAADEARAIDWGGSALIGGPSAELTDQRDSLSDHLPTALAFLVLTTVLILFAMTRSVTLPLVSLATNALTVSVAFGVLVLVFQDGHLQSLLGFTTQNALDSSMPILLFAVAFGLSTDYGVFLLQRIQEARRETDDPNDAIAIGLARSGGQITAAALLFALAMGVFAFSELVYVKEVAIGTAVAVLVDATIVRGFLLPAVLTLLGPWAWWAPRWLPGVPGEEVR
jgi:RND superfamily putative drug exporter